MTMPWAWVSEEMTRPAMLMVRCSTCAQPLAPHEPTSQRLPGDDTLGFAATSHTYFKHAVLAAPKRSLRSSLG